MFLKKRRIYADAAASTPLRPEVRERLVELLEHYGNPGSIHREGVEAKHELERVRKEAAEAIGASPQEIVFTSGGTESNNLALFGAIAALRKSHRSIHVITTAIEHSSILAPLHRLEREGCRVTYLGVDTGGLVSPEELREALREDTALVSIQYVNSETGTIQDIRALAKVLRHAKGKRAGSLPLLFHVDASQAPLYLSCAATLLGVDLMTLDAQKMMGPKGSGLLFVKRGVDLEPLLYGGAQERGLRSGTENLPLAGACARALSLAQKEHEMNTKRVAKVRDDLFEHIRTSISDVVLNGSEDARIANNLNISIPGLDAELGVLALDAQGIAISSRSACDMEEEGAPSVVEKLGIPGRAKEALRITLLPNVLPVDARRIEAALVRARSMVYAPVSGKFDTLK